jgi:hypothetical protein
MTVYVDDAEIPYGRMRMCHMIASTDEELHSMADHIGVSRKWWQSSTRMSGGHYDICLSKKKLALSFGAVAITYRQCGAMNARRRETGSWGEPGDALEWYARRHDGANHNNKIGAE